MEQITARADPRYRADGCTDAAMCERVRGVSETCELVAAVIWTQTMARLLSFAARNAGLARIADTVLRRRSPWHLTLS